MSIENEKTIEVYRKNANKYLANTIEYDNIYPEKVKQKRKKLEKFIKKNIELLPKGSKIFEIGSADGLNAKYIQSLGYDVTASDIAEDFINEIKKKGLKTIKFNVLEDEFIEKYSAVFCWRVCVHFTKEDALKVLQKTYDALKKDGLFIFNAMNCEIKETSEEWVDFSNEFHMGTKRYYKYFSKSELDDIITRIGYQIFDFHKEGGESNNKWLVYVLKKKDTIYNKK